MKEKKRKSHLKKLLKKVKKKIESNAYLVEPLNFVSLRLHLISIVIDFCGGSDNRSYISIYPNSYCVFTDKLIQRVKPLLDIKIRNKLDAEVCSVCGSFLDESKRFPDNFPNKYKICCFCLKTAVFMYSSLKKEYDRNLINSDIDGASHLRKNYKKYQEKFDNLFVIKKKGVVI